MASSECMNELRDATFDHLAELGARHQQRVDVDAVGVERDVRRPSTFLSSMVTSTRSMSDFAQTVSCERLPQRMAARIERSCFDLLDQRVERRGKRLLDRGLLDNYRRQRSIIPMWPSGPTTSPGRDAMPRRQRPDDRGSPAPSAGGPSSAITPPGPVTSSSTRAAMSGELAGPGRVPSNRVASQRR